MLNDNSKDSYRTKVTKSTQMNKCSNNSKNQPKKKKHKSKFELNNSSKMTVGSS